MVLRTSKENEVLGKRTAAKAFSLLAWRKVTWADDRVVCTSSASVQLSSSQWFCHSIYLPVCYTGPSLSQVAIEKLLSARGTVPADEYVHAVRVLVAIRADKVVLARGRHWAQASQLEDPVAPSPSPDDSLLGRQLCGESRVAQVEGTWAMAASNPPWVSFKSSISAEDEEGSTGTTYITNSSTIPPLSCSLRVSRVSRPCLILGLHLHSKN